MKIKRLLIALLFLVTLLGCEKNAEISSPKQYNQQGISFNYPSNWEITLDGLDNDVHKIIISTSGNGKFIIVLYQEADSVSLDKFSKWFSDLIAESMPFGSLITESFTPVTREIGLWSSTGIIEKFDASILGQRVPHEREFHFIKKLGKVSYLISQVTVADLPHVEPGFSLIRQTFLIE